MIEEREKGKCVINLKKMMTNLLINYNGKVVIKLKFLMGYLGKIGCFETSFCKVLCDLDWKISFPIQSREVFFKYQSGISFFSYVTHVCLLDWLRSKWNKACHIGQQGSQYSFFLVHKLTNLGLYEKVQQ